MFEQDELIAIQELINRTNLRGGEVEAVFNLKQKIKNLILPISETTGTEEVVDVNKNKSGTE